MVPVPHKYKQMYFQSAGCGSMASPLTVDYDCRNSPLGMSLGPKSCTNGSYVSRLMTWEGCAETICMATHPACHYACTNTHTHKYWQGCRSADAALKTAHPPHNAPQSEAWLQRQELNLSRVFCSIFRL
jgi:hypothetical protein